MVGRNVSSVFSQELYLYLLLSTCDSGSSQENKICNDFSPTGPQYFTALLLLTILYFLTDLSLGELIHDENFGLFEAMSAIEMMDPKMDAGMRKRDKPGQDTKAGLVTKCHASIYFLGLVSLKNSAASENFR